MLYLCRLCLKKSKYGFSLFAGGIFEKVESLTSIKIVKDDNLPQTCCRSCMGNVCLAYEFQQSIIQADRTLHELHLPLNAGEVKVEEDYTYLEDYKVVKLENAEFDSHMESSNLSRKNSDTLSSGSDITDVVMLEDKDNIYEINYLNDSEKSNIPESYNDIPTNEKLGIRSSETGEIGSNSSLECSECGVKFISKKLMHQHMAKHRVDHCPVCFVIMRRDNLKKHMQTHQESPEVCEICGKVAKNKESLRGHMNYLHKIKAKTKCDYCDKEFKSTNHCNTHMRNVHLGIRNHQCHICGKKFFSNHDLNKHINITHQRARPYVCPYCKKGFSSLYARKTHIRQHTHETPYICEICATGFRQKVSLISHMRSKHQTVLNNTKDEDEVNML